MMADNKLNFWGQAFRAEEAVKEILFHIEHIIIKNLFFIPMRAFKPK